MNPIRTLLRAAAAALALTLAVLSASCGGGGGGGTTYTSVAMQGELLSYTLDTANLSYSYTITDSQFGLAGRSGSGTLVRNADGSYTPSGVPNARIVVLPNGLLLGAVRENFGNGAITVPIIGLSNPVTTAAGLAGTYNFMQHSGLSLGAYAGSYGTFQIAADGTWSSCSGADSSGGSCSGSARNGTLVSMGGGKWQVMEGSVNVGTAIGFASGGQNVLIIDLKDIRVGGLGIGIVVGAQQTSLTSAQTDGTWIAGTSAGHWGVFTASGTSIHTTMIDGFAVNITTSFTPNSPWTGMATTQGGGVGFMAGTGVYVLETGAGAAEIGIKIQ